MEIIKPDSASYSMILADLKEYVVRRAENEDLFRDFAATSNGMMLLQLLAGFSSFNTFTAASNKRETYLPYAEVRNNALGIASSVHGYSVFQGNNDSFVCTLAPTASGILMPYRRIGLYGPNVITFLGYFDEQDNYVEAPLNVIEGNEYKIVFVTGGLKSKTIKCADNQEMFRFDATDMTETYFLTLNTQVMKTSKTMSDVTKGAMITTSNALGGIDVFTYKKFNDITIVAGDELTWNYIERVDVSGSYDLSKFQVDFGVLRELKFFNSNQFEESLDQIKVRAPMHSQTQSLMRAREDFPAIFQSYVPSAIDVNAVDMTAGTVKVSYVLSDETRLSQAKKDEIVQGVDPMRAFGVAPMYITDPVARKITVTVQMEIISLKREADESLDTKGKAEKIVRTQLQYKLGQTIDFAELEYLIERLENVKTARITVDDPAALLWNEYYTALNVKLSYTN